MKLVSNEETKLQYDSDFEVKLNIHLIQKDKEDVLDMQMHVRNTGDKDMSFTTAFHSTFTSNTSVYICIHTKMKKKL